MGGVTGQMVDVMRARFGCDPRSMSAAIAPSAGPCCYEVGTDVWYVTDPTGYEIEVVRWKDDKVSLAVAQSLCSGAPSVEDPN